MDEKKCRNIITESDQKLNNIKTRMDTFKDNLLLNKIVFTKGSVENFTKLNAASLLTRANLAISNSTDSNTSSNSNSPRPLFPTTPIHPQIRPFGVRRFFISLFLLNFDM